MGNESCVPFSRRKNLYKCFSRHTVTQLEDSLLNAETREEKTFYRTLLNLKLQLAQEKVVGEELL